MKRADHTAAHSKLVAETRKALGREPDFTLYLNTKGRLKRIGGESVYVAEPALGDGTSDLVGMLSLGNAAQWVCLEAKTGEADLQPNQRLFRDLVRSRGGFFAVFRSVDEAKQALDRARRGEHE